MDIKTATQLQFAQFSDALTIELAWTPKVLYTHLLKATPYNYGICDAFSHYVVTQPAPSNDAQTAAEILLKNWILPFGLPEILVTDKGPEYFISSLSHKCM